MEKLKTDKISKAELQKMCDALYTDLCDMIALVMGFKTYVKVKGLEEESKEFIKDFLENQPKEEKENNNVM